MLRAQKHKQQCLVWVNLRVIHNKRIWNVDVMEFIKEKFPNCTEKERTQYYKWIKAFAKGRYKKRPVWKMNFKKINLPGNYETMPFSA